MSATDVCIVTPSFNAVETLDETIAAVVVQAGDFNLWYHVQDGGSRDGTVECLETWSARLRSGSFPCFCRSVRFTFAVDKDAGMYDAINRGFMKVDGSLMSWINADDLLAQGAIQTAWNYLQEFPNDSWVGGRTALIRFDGIHTDEVHARSYSSELVAAGLHDGVRLPFMQQEGQFWRRSLWQQAGGHVDAKFQLAGDFDLWTRFAKHSNLVSLDAPLGAFRVRPGQKTGAMSDYRDEMDTILDRIGRANSHSLFQRYLHGEPFCGIVAWHDRGQSKWVRVKTATRGDTLVRCGQTWRNDPTWEILSGADQPEGPYPELGVNQIFRWLLTGTTVMRFSSQIAGEYEVHLALRNYHTDQALLVTSNALTLRHTAVPKNDDTGLPFAISFSLRMDRSETFVELTFSKLESGRMEKRPLSCALLAVEIVPKHPVLNLLGTSSER